MSTVTSVLQELKTKASERTRSTYVRHGAPHEKTLGVSVADMKLIAKTIRRQQPLALELYATGIFEGMYLAGMVADGAQMTAPEVQAWAEGAVGMPMISEYTVPWVAVENASRHSLALRWIESDHDQVAASGWATLAGMLAVIPDEALDLPGMKALLRSIPDRIKAAKNREAYTMNGFVIAAGGYVAPLSEEAAAAAMQIGSVKVDVGDTACKVPVARDSIAQIRARGPVTKRKTIRC